MNTNNTQEIELEGELILDPVKAWKEGFRAGVEKVRDILFPEIISGPRCPGGIMWETIAKKINKLLTESEAQEQEKK